MWRTSARRRRVVGGLDVRPGRRRPNAGREPGIAGEVDLQYTDGVDALYVRSGIVSRQGRAPRHLRHAGAIIRDLNGFDHPAARRGKRFGRAVRAERGRWARADAGAWLSMRVKRSCPTGRGGSTSGDRGVFTPREPPAVPIARTGGRPLGRRSSIRPFAEGCRAARPLISRAGRRPGAPPGCREAPGRGRGIPGPSAELQRAALRHAQT
jgi:hypothetical protein